MQTTTMVIDYNKVINDIARYAYIFSEGNEYLESLLIFCFKNNIETFACCRGHENKKYSFPYIGFIFRKDNINIFSNLLTLLSSSKINDYIKIRIYKYKNKYRLICGIRKKYSKNNDIINMAFKVLEDSLKLSLIYDSNNNYYYKLLSFYIFLLKDKKDSIFDFTLDNVNSSLFILLDKKKCLDNRFLQTNSYEVLNYLLKNKKEVNCNSEDYLSGFIYYNLTINDIYNIENSILVKSKLKKKVK